MRRILPFVVAAGVAAFGLGGCSGGGATNVKVAAVGRADVREVIQAPGTVTARASATLRAPADGIVDELTVRDGERVRAGQVLAHIDSPAARDRLRQAEAADQQAANAAMPAPVLDLSAMQAQADRSAAQGFAAARDAARQVPDPAVRARIFTLIARAEADYASARAAAAQAVAAVNQGVGSVTSALASITAAQRVQTAAAVQAARQTVAGLTLRAPFSGVVGLGGPPATAGGSLAGLVGRLAQQGGTGTPAGLDASAAAGPGRGSPQVAQGAPVTGGDPVITVTDVSTLALTADVDETDVLQVRPGVRATVQFDAAPGATYAATVTGVGVTPKEATGGGVTYPVTLSLGGGTLTDGTPAPSPKPGMSAVVNLEVRTAHDAVAVPSSAVVNSGAESTVWVVGAGGRAERRTVRLGVQGEAYVQVVDGVRPGERVVVRGVDAVHQGEKLPGS